MPSEQQQYILLVDDEQAILDLMTIVLEKEGFRQVLTAQSGQDALELCAKYLPSIVILDVMLPDVEGFELCRRLRGITTAPILFLTAKSTDLDKLLGFGIGGDDYITKPFNPLEVVARIKAQLRRQQLVAKENSGTGNGAFDFGRFQVRPDEGLLLVNQQPVDCPAREFQLLLFLCRHPNRVFSRNQLYERVWGETSMGDDNTVMVHMRRLREKIEVDPGQPRYLLTVRGLGYKLQPHSRLHE